VDASHAVHLQAAVDHAARRIEVGARGAERVEAHQLEVAGPQVELFERPAVAAASRAGRPQRRAVELGLSLARKVVGGALEVKPEKIVDVVTGALRGIVERERVIVLVNPADLEIVREAMEGIRASLGGMEHCVVEAERRVGRGGCLVRTPVGDIDARVETKLERAGEVVASALGRSGSDAKRR